MEFRKVCGRLPTAGEGLDVLVHQPSDWPAQIPWTPFLETSEIPCDGWGHEFVYVLDPELAEGFGVYSCGQDGVSSSEGDDRDDLNTWRRGRSWFGYYEHGVSRIELQSGVIGLGIILLAAAAGMVLRKKALGNDRVAWWSPCVLDRRIVLLLRHVAELAPGAALQARDVRIVGQVDQ